MLLRKIILERKVHYGEEVPPWLYALGYRDYCYRVAYFYPIPVAILVRLCRAFVREWTGCRARKFPWEGD